MTIIEKKEKNLNHLINKLNSLTLTYSQPKYEIEKIIGHYQVDDKKECPSFDVPKWLEKNNI